MVGEIKVNSLASKLDNHIELLEKLQTNDLSEVEDIDKALSGFLFEINSKDVIGEEQEILTLNTLFTKLNKLGTSKAKSYGLIYNKPKFVLTKKGKKRTIKVMVMEGGTQTTTKQAPSLTTIRSEPKEVTRDTRILLRANEPAPTIKDKTNATLAKSTNITSSRKETAYKSLEEAKSWLNEMTGKDLLVPKLKFINSVEWVGKAIKDPSKINLCLAAGYFESGTNTIWVDTLGNTKASIPAIVAHEFQHYANHEIAHSLESRIKYWRGNKSWDNTPDRELPAPGLIQNSSQFISTYMYEAPPMFFSAAFECRESENLAQNKYVMPGLILDKMRSETSWPLKFSRDRVINYAKQVYNEISTNISRKQIDVGLEEQMTTVLAATKVRSNDETRKELISLNKTLDRLADTTNTTEIYGVRAPALAMLIYAKNDFNLKATITDLVSKKPLELISMIKDTPQATIENLDRLL